MCKYPRYILYLDDNDCITGEQLAALYGVNFEDCTVSKMYYGGDYITLYYNGDGEHNLPHMTAKHQIILRQYELKQLQADLNNSVLYLKERQQAKDKANILVAKDTIKILKGLIKKHHEH